MTRTKTEDTAKKARRRQTIEPSQYYMKVLEILERGDMPTPQQYYDLITYDPIMAWLRGRINDEISYYYNKYSSLPERRPQNDDFVRACEAIHAAWRAQWDARQRARDAQLWEKGRAARERERATW